MEDSVVKKYMNIIEKDSSTVGIEIPKNIEIKDENINLKKIVLEVNRDVDLEDKYGLSELELKKLLRRERSDLVSKIEAGEVSEQKAQEIVDKVRKIDRSLNSITSDSKENLEKKIKRKEATRKKKWRNFVKKIREN
jgi:pyruvate formate-lyase activating enzyme-like uncharacterized protein